MLFCEYFEIFKNLYILMKICEWLLLKNVNQNFSSMKTAKYILNVSKHSQENIFTEVSFFPQKEVSTLVFFWQLSEMFNNKFFKGHGWKVGPSPGTPRLPGPQRPQRAQGPQDPRLLRVPWTTETPRISWPWDSLEPQDLMSLGRLPLAFKIQNLKTQKLWNWSINKGPP